MTETQQQVVLVLGASRGIGEATVQALAREGLRVGVGCRRMDDARRVAQQVERGGGAALPLAVDVADDAQVRAAVDALARWGGRLDALVNNAGVIEPIASIESADPAAWLRTIDINLVGAWRGIRHALPHMHGGGVVVNLSSGAAGNPLEGWSAYCASKAGLAMLTRSLHLEHGARGIRAYGLRPGVVDTDMQVNIRASGVNPISKLRREDLAPVDRPAQAIAWLVRHRPEDLAGQEVDVRDAAFAARVAGPIGSGPVRSG